MVAVVVVVVGLVVVVFVGRSDLAEVWFVVGSELVVLLVVQGPLLVAVRKI